MVPTKHFKILKKYIKTLEGKAKQVNNTSLYWQSVLEEALGIIEDNNKVVLDEIEKSQL